MTLATEPLSADGKEGAGSGAPAAVSDAPGVIVAAGAPSSSTAVLARNLSVLSLGQILTWALTLVWTVIVPRRLGSSQLGIFTLGSAVSGVLMVIIGLGMYPLLVREIASDHRRAPRLIGTAIVLRALFAVPALIFAVLFATLGPFHGDEEVAVLLGWVTCLFTAASEPISAGFQAMERMKYLTYFSVLAKLVGTVAGIALVLVGVRAIGLLIVGVLIGAVVGGLMLVWARPYFDIDWHVTRRGLWDLLVKSLPYWSFVLFYTFYLWIDSLLLAGMTSSTVLGWYGVPTRLFGTLMFIPTILSTAWLSRLVRAHHEGGEPALRLTARPGVEMVAVLSMPVCVGAVMLADQLVRGLYGSGFAESGPVFALLALCVPPMYLNVMASQVMVARNQQMTCTKMMALASVLNPVANLLLIPYFQRNYGNGALGSAIAMVITEVALAVIFTVLIRDIFDRRSALRLLKGAVATGAMAGVVLLGLRVDTVVAVFSGLLSWPLFALGVRVLSADERRLVASLASGVMRSALRRRSISGADA